jgi:hypothetical protein
MKLLRTRTTLSVAAILVAALALAACGGGGDDDEGEEPGGALSGASTSTSSATAEATSSGATGGPGGNSSTGNVTPTEEAGEETAEFPVGFEVDTTPYDVTSGNPCGTLVRFDVIEAMVDTAVPLDPPLAPTREGEPGDLYVHFRLGATGISSQCGGANVSGSIVRLEVDGRPMASGNNVNFTLRNGESETFVVIYAVSPDASSFRLLLGEAGEEEVAIDLEVPGFEG